MDANPEQESEEQQAAGLGGRASAKATSPAGEPCIPSAAALCDVLDGLLVAAAVLTPDGVVLEANAVALRASKLDRSSVVGKHLGETYWWQGLPRSREQLDDAIRRAVKGENTVFLTNVRATAAILRRVRVMVYPLAHSESRSPLLIVSVMDVNEHIKSERGAAAAAALLRSRTRLAQVTQTKSVAIAFRDDRGRLHDVNEGFCELTGYSRSDVVNGRVTWESLIYEDGMDTAAADPPVQPFETEIVGKDGRRIPVLANFSRSVGPVSEQIFYMVDNTEHKRAESELRVHKEEYRATFELAGVGKYQGDPDSWRLLQVNRKLCEITGYSVIDLIGTEISELAHHEDRDAEREAYEQAMQDGEKEWACELRYRNNHDGARWVSVTGTLIDDLSGAPARTVCVVQDITDRIHAAQQLADLNRTLEERINERTLSLIRNQEQLRQLSSELSLAEQRERRRLAGDLHDYLAQLLVACRLTLNRVKSIVRSPMGQNLLQQLDDHLNEGLTYTRSLVAQLSPVVLYEAGLQAALYWLAEQMPRYGLDVTVEVVQPIGNPPENDGVILFQAVRELLFNVIKHAKIDKAVLVLDQDAHWLKISVVDAGAGFDPVATVENAAESGRFGLFSLRERLEVLGGSLDVQSAPGKGGKVTILFPLERSPALTPAAKRPPENASPPALPPAPPPKRRIRILLADDHNVVRKGLRRLLEMNADIQVIGEASNGEEAVELARELSPDVVVMDVNMPRLNGLEATQRIREEQPVAAIIALSVFESSAMARAMKAAGAKAYLTKGGPPEDLFEAIRAAASNKLR